ncbi:MAG TPA: DNA repair protein RadC [Oscillospiraceae bacterium]|nr:DNA repair protein RadC [Oscillospiraceae bacterium]
MGVHDGHRGRMKTRFLEHGLDNFDDINVLELLLFYALPRCDTNVVAHRLLDRFGSLPGVLEAPAEELARVEGVGDSAAALLRLIPQVSRRYMMEREGTAAHALSDPASAGCFFVPRFLYETDEVVYLACLDSVHRVLSCTEVGRGVVNSAEVSVRKIVELALRQNAAAVILAHNHVNGLAIPSKEDELTTRQLASALNLVGIGLIDHIIVAGGEFVSMADSGMLSAR